ncbi:hypothetical protein OKW41_004252 [Paraburkholderia sp. UCT70]|uniref:hypothetical protein n=1 Tax=Paraburkholderia sp. UCT70 TaxID=2991068 RepID=UPI003D216D3C
MKKGVFSLAATCWMRLRPYCDGAFAETIIAMVTRSWNSTPLLSTQADISPVELPRPSAYAIQRFQELLRVSHREPIFPEALVEQSG